ncbi:coadhesin-like [Ruditapes philippinarum]|uniref:coadhesin-like n=1 Tax=Ruditapes philippinarum TaxID=129788 RepID=UPI00295B6F12|nr:coadhesin-like [Ruditapes philippinarum]
MMLYKGFLLFLLASPGDVASLSCYSCNNVDSLDSCKTITTCGKRESCFKRLQKRGQYASFTLGCTQNENCGNIPVYTNVSKLSNGQLLQECEECCGVDQCNKDLCNHKTPPPCSDNMENCAFWNKDFDICEDIHKAKLHCRKFCKLCDLVDGNWADWSSWSTCDVTCGHGKHTRTRTCTNPSPAYKGLDCNGTNTDTKPCTRPLCPVHGGWAGWSSWESCPVTCDIGIQKRHRKCTNPSPLRHGNHCFGDSMDVKLCKQNPCDASNGGWSNWNTWSSCSVSCGGGVKTRSRSCSNPVPGIHGKPCVGDNMQVVTCNKEDCQSNSTVAFNAYYVTDCSPSAGQTMIFSKILMNEGEAYNPSTGVFVAPKDGTYTFYAQLCINSRTSIHFDIMVGSKVYATAYGYDSSAYSCPSTQAIAQMKSGDKAFVQWKSWTQSSNAVPQSYTYVRNFFSGKYSNP